MEIVIQSSLSEHFGSSINEIIRIIDKVERNHKEKSDWDIGFDLSNCKFSYPCLLNGLHLLGRHYLLRGFNVAYKIDPVMANNKGYLDLVYFPGGVNCNRYDDDGFKDFMQPYLQKTYIPIIQFETGNDKAATAQRENALSTVNRIIKYQCNLPANLYPAVVYLIDEAVQNILDHSKEEYGSIFAQCYPSKNFMDICIGDVGIGIFQSYINRGMNDVTNDEEAMTKAVNGVSTKDLPESRGFGISTSRKMLVEGLNGKYFLLSGKSAYLYTDEKEAIVNLPGLSSWQGSILSMRIPMIISTGFNYINYLE